MSIRKYERPNLSRITELYSFGKRPFLSDEETKAKHIRNQPDCPNTIDLLYNRCTIFFGVDASTKSGKTNNIEGVSSDVEK